MSGRRSKRKGANGEREFAALVGGTRTPLSGAVQGFENDVVLPNGWRAEVKRRKSGFKQLYEWLMDEREKPDVVAIRTDRQPWIVCMTLERFLELMGGVKDDKGRDSSNEAGTRIGQTGS